MSDVFEATYSDWKVIRGRKCVQIVLEVPLELSNTAYTVLGGMPNPAEEIWVAVARLDLKKLRRNDKGETVSAGIAGPASEATGRVPARVQNPYAKRAAILCNDIRFQKFLSERYGIITGTDAAAIKVRELCEVTSRSEILPGTAAADRFDILESAYRVESRV